MTNALTSRQPDAKARLAPASVPFTPRSIDAPRREAPDQTPPLYEQLVTSGHVYAARMRHFQPHISTIAVVMVVLGFGLFLLLYRPAPTRSLEEIIGLRRAVEQQRLLVVNRHFTPGGEVVQAAERAGKQPKDFVQVDAAAPLIEELLKSLQVGNGLTTATTAKLVKQAPDAYWKASWLAGQVGYVEGDDAYLIGTILFGQHRDHPTPGYMRWVGLFRKSGGKWHYASLTTQADSPYAISQYPAIAAADLPLTLPPLLPATTNGK